jgi:hypothetical protein
MPIFIVGITENITTRYSVEASDPREAEAKALELFNRAADQGYLSVSVNEQATSIEEVSK